MLRADQAPYFETCPRCGTGGLERLKTHAFCVNCNYDEIYSDELCVIPQWALDAVKAAGRKPSVHKLQPMEKAQPVLASVATRVPNTNSDGTAA
jgi:D-Tyr-tRNAtyr deacylase